MITRHLFEKSVENANVLKLTAWGKYVYRRRAETVERSFADAKQHHGHRYARFRGLLKVQIQCFLAAAAQSIKKMALLEAYLRKIGLNARQIVQIVMQFSVYGLKAAWA